MPSGKAFDLLPFDHILPVNALSSPNPIALFYYDPGTIESAQLLDYLSQYASTNPSFRYVIRYRPPKKDSPGKRGERGERRSPLSGYGVEMVLKKTDYLVVDDRALASSHEVTQQSGGSITDGMGIFQVALGDDPWSDVATPITKDEVRGLSTCRIIDSKLTSSEDMGLQATSLILASEDPLEALTQLSQDFPKYSAALARRVVVPPNIRNSVTDILYRGSVAPAIYINGKAYRDNEINAFS